MERKFAFNEIVNEYDKYRPMYPNEVFIDIIEYSGIKKEDQILEVGCGTGQATTGFVNLGYNKITCVELGKNLAEFTAEKFAHEKSVKVYNSAFEDWNDEANKFDLAISATAFHWIKPEIGYPKVDSLLRDKGSIGFFWTYHAPGQNDTFIAISECYKKYAPHLDYSNLSKTEDIIAERIKATKDSNLFENLEIKKYEWFDQYSSDDYIAWLNTNSAHQALESQIKERLFYEIKNVIEKHGGELLKPQLVVSYLARKR